MTRPTLDAIRLGPDEARAVIDYHKQRMKHEVESGNHERLKKSMARVDEIWAAMPPQPSY